jgi:hypothetical protein
MENRIKRKTENYTSGFKEYIKEIINKELNGNNIISSDVKQILLEKIYNYPRLNFTSDDFSKRKRLKNNVPLVDRCNALKAFGEQCTRKRKSGCEFCGTHIKGTPNGIIEKNQNNKIESRKIKLQLENNNGIYSYVDINGKEYVMEDILDK